MCLKIGWFYFLVFKLCHLWGADKHIFSMIKISIRTVVYTYVSTILDSIRS